MDTEGSPMPPLPAFKERPQAHPSQILIDFSTPTPPPQRTSIKIESPADKELLSGVNGVIDLCSPSPIPRRTAIKTEYPGDREMLSSVIDLCSPSPGPKHTFIKRESPENIIDLTTSPVARRPICPLPRRVLTFMHPKLDSDAMLVDPPLSPPSPYGSGKENLPDSPELKPTTRTLVPLDHLRLGTFFPDDKQGERAIYSREAHLGQSPIMDAAAADTCVGNIWRRGQTKRASDGSIRRITYRCNHYGQPSATHRDDIDPSDHRAGRTIRTNCSAHVNLPRVPGGGWQITVIDWEHNHPPQVPVGGHIPRPPTEGQRELVTEYATSGNFTRSHLSSILRARYPDSVLEPRQVSNLINSARKKANEEVQALGGDIPSVLAKLRELKDVDARWDWDVKLDEKGVVVALWWQSPTQVELSQRFYDILINDDTYCRNQYGYPLNIGNFNITTLRLNLIRHPLPGIVIDNFGRTRNCWYAIHRTEDTETHNWVFKNHLRGSRRPPEVLGSDRHSSLIASAVDTLPLTFHLYCLHHLGGNIATNLRPVLRSDWDQFNCDFWVAYRAVSPEEFEREWHVLTTRYPSAAKYLDEELYSCRSHWAWAWVSTIFTGGVRTTGRVEGENRVNKAIGGPKKTFLQLFNGLNDRTQEQTSKDLIQVRQVSGAMFPYAGPK
jgi:hypothetical protein